MAPDARRLKSLLGKSDAGGLGGGKWMDARTQIRGIFRNMLRIEDAADGRLPPQGTPGGVSKQALKQSRARYDFISRRRKDRRPLLHSSFFLIAFPTRNRLCAQCSAFVNHPIWPIARIFHISDEAFPTPELANQYRSPRHYTKNPRRTEIAATRRGSNVRR